MLAQRAAKSRLKCPAGCGIRRSDQRFGKSLSDIVGIKGLRGGVVAKLGSFVGEVERAIASGDAAKRVATLRKMTDLFTEQASVLAEDHVEVFDEIFIRLSRSLEFRARVELADRLADVTNAPAATIKDLAADDDIGVARPVLERSARLTESDLIVIAERKGQGHLLALSRRSILPERVTDILVDRGDERVVRSVAGNEGARFSKRAFSQLLGKVKADPELRTILRSRQDLPADAMRKLTEIAGEAIRERLVDEMGEGAGEAVSAALEGVAAELATKPRSEVLLGDFADAAQRVAALAQHETIAEDRIEAWIREGQLAVALAAMAHLADIPVEMVARAYHAPNYDPLLFIVRSLRFGWGTFKLLLTHKAGRALPSDLARSAFESFQQLSVQTAQRVVKFTVAQEFSTTAAA